jgi:HSP20 family protein
VFNQEIDMAKETKKPSTEIKKAEEVPVEQALPTRALSPFEEMEERMERLFEDFIPRGWMYPFHWGQPMRREFPRFEMKMPKVDIIDRDNEVVLKAEIPGVNKEDLKVSVDEGTVTISGKTSHEEKEEKGDYYRSEIRRGSFIRTVVLPRGVDGAKAKANFKDGILELTMPKLEKSKRVQVKVS